MVDSLSPGDSCLGLSVGTRRMSLMVPMALIVALMLHWQDLLTLLFCRAVSIPFTITVVAAS